MEIISDKNHKSLRIKKILLKKLSNLKINRPNLTVVIGGDGFMLQKIKVNLNYFTELILATMDF